MVMLYLGNGKRLDTMELPDNICGIYCKMCGERLGWADHNYNEEEGDRIVAYCDECCADLNSEEDEDNG